MIELNLEKYNKTEVLRIIWEIFSDYAKSVELNNITKYFWLEGMDSLSYKAFDRCLNAGLIPKMPDKRQCPPFDHMVRKVYYSALNMGLIQPSKADANMVWNQETGAFQFTTEGLSYFSEGFISIDDPGYLAETLEELKRRIPTIEGGQISLLLEAQRCMKSGCYRAAMVLIGIANEDSCLSLLDAIPTSINSPQTSSPLIADWANCNNQSNVFAARWKPGIRILDAIKTQLRSPGRGKDWMQWWEMIPGSLYTLGEAVRLARNSAAHSTDRIFIKAEVALLLSAMPIQIEMIAEITVFLTRPPITLSSINL